MLHILLGPDDYSKKSYIQALVKDKGADLMVYHLDDEMPPVSKLTERDLFSKTKVFVFNGIMPEMGNSLEKIINSPNNIVVSISSIDKRKKENKDLLAHSSIKIKEFLLPHGMELNKWIEKRVGDLGGKISKPAIDELAVRLGRDSAKETKAAGKIIAAEEIYSLWQADSEIQKLLAYAKGRQVELEDITELVLENLEIDVFEIINAIGEGKKQQALDLIQKFIKTDVSSDEKTGVIQLNALLSEQMRSVSIAQDFIQARIPDAEIVKRTGWKSGRVYAVKKIASRLSPQKVLQTLPKLEALDQELKTSQTPPRVLLEMVLAQIF